MITGSEPQQYPCALSCQALCQRNPLIATDQKRTPKISVSDSIELKNT